MEFIRRVGNQAEVNDGGKIRRLPFSGEGVPPQPGARINPVRDACCCPGSVPLEPRQADEKVLRSDPRREIVTKKKKRGFNLVVPFQFLTNQAYYYPDNYPPHINPSDYGKFGWIFPLSSLMGTDIKVLLWSVFPSSVLPLPEAWLQWNLKDNSFKLVKLKPGSTLYYFALPYFGLDYPFERKEYVNNFALSINWRSNILFQGTKNLNEEEIKSLYRPIDSRGYKIKVFQPFRNKMPFDDERLNSGVEPYYNIDDPKSSYLKTLKEFNPEFSFWHSTDYVKPLLSKEELINIPAHDAEKSPRNRVANNFGVHYHLRPESIVTPKIFLKWYKNPESFRYERLP